jgi:hypothetical protein
VPKQRGSAQQAAETRRFFGSLSAAQGGAAIFDRGKRLKIKETGNRILRLRC